MCMSLYRIELILEKNCLLIFWVPLFLRAKAVTDVKTACIRAGHIFMDSMRQISF